MSKTAIYWLANGVIKRLTTDVNPPFDATYEAAHPELDDFTLAGGPWKYDAPPTTFNKIPATQQEYADAYVDQPMKILKQQLVEHHNSSLLLHQAIQAYKDAVASVTTFVQFKPYFADIAAKLDDEQKALDAALQQIYANMQ